MPKPMKDGLDARAIQRIATTFSAVQPSFPSRQFTESAIVGMRELELRQRVDFLIELLARHLPKDFETTADLLEQVELSEPPQLD